MKKGPPAWAIDHPATTSSRQGFFPHLHHNLYQPTRFLTRQPDRAVWATASASSAASPPALALALQPHWLQP